MTLTQYYKSSKFRSKTENKSVLQYLWSSVPISNGIFFDIGWAIAEKKRARGLKILEFQGVPIEEIANGISKSD